MEKKILVEKIRLWKENPRYNLFSNVEIKNIGKEYSNEKDYKNDIPNIVENLIKNKKMVSSLIELLDNIVLSGFEDQIDRVIITKKISCEDDVYYVLEGNRRILCLYLINNIFNTHNIIKNKLNESDWENIKKILKNINDSNQKTFMEIKCDFLDVNKEDENKIWRIINSRHFGVRKGKLNWPRGIILKSITNKVEEWRNENNINDGEELDNASYSKLISRLEAFTGKKISERDMYSSLWTSHVFQIYNDNTTDEKDRINFENTDVEKDLYEEDNDEKNNVFSISSLELALNTIKIFDIEKNKNISLSVWLKIRINFKKWVVSYDDKLSSSDWIIICKYLIESIKQGKLNTRRFDNEYFKEMLLIFEDKYENKIKILESSEKKLKNYLAVSIQDIKNNIDVKKIDFNNRDQKDEFLKIKENVLDIYIIEKKSKKLIDLFKDNTEIFPLLYIWINELKLIENEKLKLSDKNIIPYISIANALRISGWHYCSMLFLKGDNLKHRLEKYINKNINSFKMNSYKKQLKKISDAIKTRNFNFEFLTEEIQIQPNKILIMCNEKNIPNKEQIQNYLIAIDFKILLNQDIKESLKNNILNGISELILWSLNIKPEINKLLHVGYFSNEFILEENYENIKHDIKKHLSLIRLFLENLSER